MVPTLTTHDTRFDDPDPATIAKVLAALDGDRHVLATLGDSDADLSPGGRRRARRGSRSNSRTARSINTTGARRTHCLSSVVTDMFQRYARGDQAWREGMEWNTCRTCRSKTPWHSTWVGYIVILVIVAVSSGSGAAGEPLEGGLDAPFRTSPKPAAVELDGPILRPARDEVIRSRRRGLGLDLDRGVVDAEARVQDHVQVLEDAVRRARRARRPRGRSSRRVRT